MGTVNVTMTFRYGMNATHNGSDDRGRSTLHRPSTAVLGRTSPSCGLTEPARYGQSRTGAPVPSPRDTNKPSTTSREASTTSREASICGRREVSSCSDVIAWSARTVGSGIGAAPSSLRDMPPPGSQIASVPAAASSTNAPTVTALRRLLMRWSSTAKCCWMGTAPRLGPRHSLGRRASLGVADRIRKPQQQLTSLPTSTPSWQRAALRARDWWLAASARRLRRRHRARSAPCNRDACRSAAGSSTGSRGPEAAPWCRARTARSPPTK